MTYIAYLYDNVLHLTANYKNIWLLLGPGSDNYEWETELMLKIQDSNHSQSVAFLVPRVITSNQITRTNKSWTEWRHFEHLQQLHDSLNPSQMDSFLKYAWLDIVSKIATNLVYNQHTHQTFSIQGGRTGEMDYVLKAYMGVILPSFKPSNVLFYHNQHGVHNLGKSLSICRIVLGGESPGIGNQWIDMYCKDNQIDQVTDIRQLVSKLLEKSI